MFIILVLRDHTDHIVIMNAKRQKRYLICLCPNPQTRAEYLMNVDYRKNKKKENGNLFMMP